ncbi:MAG: DUF4910 domain-containing protein [Bacteroidia bacterium]|nr:DUF4910 domain-containing protein [Bacteroidia bacterium]
MIKRTALVAAAMLSAFALQAQDQKHFEKIVAELSSARYQGRGYARDGVLKAGKYIAREFRKAGADEVILQPFALDVNTFPGKVKMSADGRKLTPGVDFVMREYSPGVHASGKLYRIDTLNYDSEKIFADLAKPENEGCFVVCDFWYTYKHSKDFSKMQSFGECRNAGMVYTWSEPLKFYKAYAEKVVDKPIIWTTEEAIEGVESISADVDNKFLKDYVSDNVIAKVEGARHDSCYVFTAHYDHLGNLGRRLYYPGANDNASGTAGIITLAEYYAANRPEFDMYFVAFSGEDTNLRGSTWFVNHPVVPLESIKYLFNLDMIGDNNPVQYCETSDEGQDGFNRFEAINSTKHYFKGFDHGELAANSDHYPFAQKHVPCIFFENESGDAFPFYHTWQDNVKTMRLETYIPLMNLIKDFISEY